MFERVSNLYCILIGRFDGTFICHFFKFSDNYLTRHVSYIGEIIGRAGSTSKRVRVVGGILTKVSR